jgi:hypothetical protein
MAVWIAAISPDDGDVHVWPHLDLIAHELAGTTCVCGPAVEQHQRLLIVHHSLDGRERNDTQETP